ncbi:MAG: hypothetical protein U5R31_04945 [Acidimicrobiia bacterium]|nr:hypothetical protein [Acidimicrobiia bacterium]
MPAKWSLQVSCLDNSRPRALPTADGKTSNGSPDAEGARRRHHEAGKTERLPGHLPHELGQLGTQEVSGGQLVAVVGRDSPRALASSSPRTGMSFW